MDLVRDAVLGVEFEIDPRFERLDPTADDGAGGQRRLGRGGEGRRVIGL